MNWQPIDTAPKDRRILLFRPAMSNWRIGVGRFMTDEFSKKPRPFWDMEGVNILTARQCPPTHWCELVEPEVKVMSKLTDPQLIALRDIRCDDRRNLYAGKRACEMLARLERKYLITQSASAACGWELTPTGLAAITPDVGELGQ